MKKIFKIIILSFLVVSFAGCASLGRKWKSMVSGEDAPVATDTAKPATNPKDAEGVSFNTQPNFGNYPERQYKRVTKDNFTQQQMLEESAGSLWRKEGQGSYLFTQNNLRVLGDVINVDVDGRIAENLNTKVEIIKKAQAKFDAPPPKSPPKSITSIPRLEDDSRGVASNGRLPVPAPAPVAPAIAPVSVAPPTVASSAVKEKEAMKFDPVPCRIVEKNPDGSYRVKGMEMVFIGRKEYKLIVSGIVRADDINTDTIAGTKIMDSKFELIPTTRDISL